ncbi:uncharacterized protein LOC126746911 [Anthonomus grandis grandis]|uniref:uncharacterized protein LOC126746911 n=1 Tax=Anthonomus grandis grandis TaxID=2921223 RepID=UPI00216667C9|nr:uncharacterized protein LOC126746911 [Anthonomus grandis grandis]
MESGVFGFNSKPVFKNQPILCPWVSRQPHPSSQLIKNKLCSLEKRRESISNHGTSRKSLNPTTAPTEEVHAKTPRSNNSHFFYFLRLMQLFPETHPATLHAVLTACKSNFFYAIDKLLYAQKCKTALTIRSRPGFKNKMNLSRPRLNLACTAPRGQFVAKTTAEVSQNLVDKPFAQVVPNNIQAPSVCIESNANQTEQQSYNSSNSIIEIVCYDNESVVKHNDSMEIETFSDNLESIEPTIGENMPEVNEDNDPPVIVVETSQESDEVICINNGGTTLEAISNQSNSAEKANLTDITAVNGKDPIVELD